MSLKKVLCRLGMHKFISMPVKCITLANQRNVIVCASVCQFCGYRDDI
ncbi:hypothetical protein GHK50_21060 [Sinorhizobium medicae]|uniref:Uncharacterized protein n=1 Tax=Sinorhizobium medicae TaxID=110321 RepID=A0A6G1WUW0_9HYPH|nr:hypothetical protein [Sinorhizobium medicae]MQW73461.1 hypothetical protein [Sinorhizobium medicae]MQX85556.1 hypothetical protein [Sinorhizobium medicae]